MEVLPVEINYLIFNKLDDKDLMSLAYVNKYFPEIIVGYGRNKSLSKIVNYIFFNEKMDSGMLFTYG